MGVIPSGNGTVTPGPLSSQVVCTKANWYDIAWFFFANYVLHALSVRSLPGESFVTSAVFKLCCLFIPYTGLRRGLCLLSRASNLDPDRLQAAARANAFCMIIRNEDWRPESGQTVPHCKIEKQDPDRGVEDSGTDRTDKNETETNIKKVDTLAYELKESPSSPSGQDSQIPTEKLLFRVEDNYEPIVQPGVLGWLFRVFVQTWRFRSLKPTSGKRIDLRTVKLHGLCRLADGYSLSMVPEDVKVFPRHKELRPRLVVALQNRDIRSTRDALGSGTKVSTANTIPRILFSLMQTVSGVYALYRAQGRQIQKYGYTAYGLTVLPYMIVSVFNILGSLLTAEYELIYMTHSAVMDEMIQRGGVVDGVVGSLQPDDHENEDNIPFQSIEQSGETIQFEEEGAMLRYRNAGLRHVFSEPLSVGSMPAPPTQNVYSAFYGPGPATKYWQKRAKKRKKIQRPETEKEQTESKIIVTVPSHGPLRRLPQRPYQKYLDALSVVLLVLAFATPILVNFGLTRFQANQSTSNQRSFTMNWLAEGMVMGYVVGSIEKLNGGSRVVRGLAVMFISYGCYCVMGFEAVAEEMIDLGTCTAV